MTLDTFDQSSQEKGFVVTIKSLMFRSERQTVVTPPGCFAGSTNCVCEFMSFTKTSRTSTYRGDATHLTVLHDQFADPVDLGITTDCLVVKVNHDDLKELVCRVLTDPIRVQKM